MNLIDENYILNSMYKIKCIINKLQTALDHYDDVTITMEPTFVSIIVKDLNNYVLHSATIPFGF